MADTQSAPGDRRLTSYSQAGGCAAKVCQQDLRELLGPLAFAGDPRLLVGGETSDDAGVFRLDDGTALVLTVDVLPPMVDDPQLYGAIAAANSLSDVYAMGGTPLAALCILSYPMGEIPPAVIRAVLTGAESKVREAGAVIAGGHTVRGVEVKFGLAVTGSVHPARVVRNIGARPGDVLVLTKPLGIGVISAALRADIAPPGLVAEAGRVMSRLNRAAAEAMVEVGPSAATDVTGFGLLGHAWEMAQGGEVDLVIESAQVPFISGALELARQGVFSGGSARNRRFIEARADFASGVNEATRMLLCDAQTSGGLLIAVPGSRSRELLAALDRTGVETRTVIGRVEPGTGRLIVT